MPSLSTADPVAKTHNQATHLESFSRDDFTTRLTGSNEKESQALLQKFSKQPPFFRWLIVTIWGVTKCNRVSIM